MAEKFRMNKGESNALEASISVWERRLNGEDIDEGRMHCPLCVFEKDRNAGEDTCHGCVIHRHTGRFNCLDTPYTTSRDSEGRVRNEVEFLKSLRKYNPISKGDIVINTDGSYHLRLTDNGLSNIGNISWDRGGDKFKYVVVETGLQLPSSGSRFGKNSNDTIVRDLNSNEYIFTMERFLQVAEEEKEICSECGTEL